MTSLERSTALAIALSATLGCGAMMSSTPTRRTAFDASRIPPGDGFSCFERVVGKESKSPCYRTADECSSERDKAKASADVTSVGTCEKQATAACFVIHREKTGALVENQSLLGDQPACFRSLGDCTSAHDSWGEQVYGVSELTACGDVSGGAVNAKTSPSK